MIPIHCPNCGRHGNVPPDRLNSRLSCKACYTVFHMDAGGRMVLGEPGAAAAKQKSKTARATTSAADIDLAQTWRDVPRPVKLGVPSACLLVLGWMWLPSFSSGLAYQDQAEAVGRALVQGDRARVVAAATPATAEAAGKWYDLAHASLVEKGMGSLRGDAVRAALLDGNPEAGGTINMSVAVVSETDPANFNVELIQEDGTWKVDGAKSLAEAERMLAPVKLAKKK